MISMSGNSSLQPSFFPLIIDKWCFETAGEESSDLPRPVYKKKPLFEFQHAFFYLILALLLLWKKWQMVVLPHAFSTPKKDTTNSKQGRAVDLLSWFCAQETFTNVVFKWFVSRCVLTPFLTLRWPYFQWRQCSSPGEQLDKDYMGVKALLFLTP